MIPIFGFETQRDVLSESVPITVGPSHPELRDLEGFATPAGTYNGNDYSFDQFRARSGGRWFSQTSKLLINWGLPFFLRFPYSPSLVALAAALLAFFRQRAALQLEILALRHQLGVLQCSVQRPKLTATDRLLWAWLAAVWTDWQPSSINIKLATVIGWHRKGFRLFWTWKIRRERPGRPAVPADVRSLIRAMSRDNPLCGAPRIHGELLKLGISVGETSVS